MKNYRRPSEPFPKRTKYVRKSSSPDLNSSQSGDSSSASSNDDSLSVVSISDFFRNLQGNRHLTSSPVHFLNESDSNANESSSSSSSFSSSSSESGENLYSGSNMSIDEFSSKFMDIISTHQLSDAATNSILTFITEALPLPNRCPRLNDLKDKKKVDEKVKAINHDSGQYFVIDLEYQIRSILDYNEDALCSDFCVSSENVTEGHICNDSAASKYLQLIVNTDGVSSIFQSRQFNVWPIMASIVNLNPSKRFFFRNLLLCCLFYGPNKPDFRFFLDIFVDQVQSTSISYGCYTIFLRVLTLCADLPAKANCLLMNQFNGYDSCPNCNIHGTYSHEHKKMLFPPGECSLRSEEEFLSCARAAEMQQNVIQGIKGLSPLSKVMRLSNVPFDAMHLVYLGIVRTFVCHSLSHRLIDETEATKILLSVRVPSCFKRKPRSLMYKFKFKAMEWRHFILYYFVLFLDSDNEELKVFMTTLSTIVHSLLEPVILEELADVQKMIFEFRRLSVHLFGSSVNTFTMHAFEHLPDQVRHYGPLWATSASVFESAFYQLKRLVTGTRNEGRLIVERFILRRKKNFKNTVSCEEVKILGSTVKKNVTITSACLLYDVLVHQNDDYVYRFQVGGKIFHSHSYPRRRSSASFYGFSNDGRFLRIDHILRQTLDVICLCTELIKVKTITDLFDTPSLEASFAALLRRYCKTYLVEEGNKCIVQASCFSGHIVLVTFSHFTFGTAVILCHEPE